MSFWVFPGLKSLARATFCLLTRIIEYVIIVTMSRPFEVRDIRNKGFFVVDDIYLNGFAKYLGPIGSAVYFSLCRHADKNQSSFPSQEMIANEYAMNKRTVVRYLKLLIEMNLINMERVRGYNGKWERNTYFLIDKSHWRKPGDTESLGQPGDFNDIHQVTQSHTKDTHIKDTHILSNISELDFEQIANSYKVPVSFVRSKYDDLVNYCDRTGKKYKNYLAALRNFVKQDALKVRKEAIYANSKHGIDARSI